MSYLNDYLNTDPVLVASYASGTGDTVINNENNDAVGNSFLSTGGTLNSCKFWLKKGGTITGNAYAKLYAHTGTFGNGLPTGTALATSDAFDVSTLTTSYQWITFTFSGANIIQLSKTYYCIIFEWTTTATGTDKIVYKSYGSSSNGNMITKAVGGSWSNYVGYCNNFYLYENTRPTPSFTNDAIGTGSWSNDAKGSGSYTNDSK